MCLRNQIGGILYGHRCKRLPKRQFYVYFANRFRTLPVYDHNNFTFKCRSADLLGQFTIPIMILALGVSLAKLKVHSLGRSALLSLVRIGGGMALGFGIGALFGLEGVELGVVVLQASMPVAVFNYLFAQYYNNEPEEVAGLVVVSTAMSFMMLPFLLPAIL